MRMLPAASLNSFFMWANDVALSSVTANGADWPESKRYHPAAPITSTKARMPIISLRVSSFGIVMLGKAVG